MFYSLVCLLKKNIYDIIKNKRGKIMTFIKQSSDFIENSKTEIDNIFFNDYLPYAPSDFVKVYVYLNYISNSSDSPDNELDRICKILNMSELDVMNALQYWENEGLLKMYGDPVQVVLFPLKSAISNDNKWSKSKYEEFNLIIQDIKKRQILPNEFNAYYTTMETLKIEIPAFIMIVKFCVMQKGESVGYSYINAVAKNWADEGAHTVEDVTKKIEEFEQSIDKVSEVIKALKSRRKATFEDRQFYKKWTEEFGFKHEVILYVAKNIKVNPTIYRLDAKLLNYYELKLYDIKEIDGFELDKDNMFRLAKNITKAMGVYYDNLEPVITGYIQPWLSKGYDEQTLLIIANSCFKNSIRTLEGMNNTINKFYNHGIVSLQSLNQEIENSIKTDNIIKNILQACGLSRNVNSWDRDFYRTWTYSWKLNDELILYGASLSKDKAQPMQYLNKILADWKDKNIDTVDKAKEISQSNTQTKSKNTKNSAIIRQREYTKEELESVFSNIDEWI